MSKLTENEQGFSAIEIVLILVFFGIVGFVGWFTYHVGHSSKSSIANSPQVTASSSISNKTANAKATITTTSPAKPTATTTSPPTRDCGIVATAASTGWQVLTVNSYGYSVSYPSGWQATTDNSGSLLVTSPGAEAPTSLMRLDKKSMSDDISAFRQYSQDNGSSINTIILSDTTCVFSERAAERLDLKITSSAYSQQATYETDFFISSANYTYVFSLAAQSSSGKLLTIDPTQLKIAESLKTN